MLIKRSSKWLFGVAALALVAPAARASDLDNLYNPNMGLDPRGGIRRSGSFGAYTYAVRANMGNKPVNFVSWFDAVRFANWLHNGQASSPQGPGTTEDGRLGPSGPVRQGVRPPPQRLVLDFFGDSRPCCAVFHARRGHVADSPHRLGPARGGQLRFRRSDRETGARTLDFLAAFDQAGLLRDGLSVHGNEGLRLLARARLRSFLCRFAGPGRQKWL